MVVRGAETPAQALRRLASMPFLDRLELAAVSGVPDRTMHDAVAVLVRRGLAASVSHATGLLRPTRRYYPTAAGLLWLAQAEGVSPEGLLRVYPVSAQWRRVLMERLDAVAVIYRLASSIAAQQGPIGFRWYRAMPMDAAIALPGGRTVGVVRQGATSDRTGFAKRLWRLREGPHASGVLLLMPDEVRLRHARRLLAGSPLSALLALEQDTVWRGPDEPIWRLPSVNAALGLRQALSYVDRGGAFLLEPGPARATFPGDIDASAPGGMVPDWLLPALLKPAEKRALDLLSDWPGIVSEDLRGLMGVSRARLAQIMAPLADAQLVSRIAIEGRRLALADRGLALLARRDRTAVGAARKRWSVAPLDPEATLAWRNVSGRRTRQLLRNIEHTEAVHRFVTSLVRQSRSQGWEIVQLDPPQRASRYFRHDGILHSVNADAFGVLRKDGRTWPFFLEWERRAVRPVTMAARLAPYLRYFSSRRPTDDHGAQPAVLVVFDSDIAQTHFLRVAREEMDRTRASVPLWVSHRSALERVGPLGPAWRPPDGREPTLAFQRR